LDHLKKEKLILNSTFLEYVLFIWRGVEIWEMTEPEKRNVKVLFDTFGWSFWP
jgi:hypothetical protein